MGVWGPAPFGHKAAVYPGGWRSWRGWEPLADNTSQRDLNMAIQTGAKGATIAGVSYPPYFYIDFLTPDIEALAVQGGDAVMVPSRGLATAAAQALTNSAQVAAGANLPGLSAATDILRSAIPFVKTPSGSVAANGAITLGTPLATAYTGGCYMYLPGGVAFGGAVAGWYYVIMSSTNLGVIYNNRYVTGNPAHPKVLTPISAAGPGVFAGANSLILAQNTTLLGNSMGANGSLTIAVLGQVSATAGGKIYNGTLGGTLAGGFYVENDARPISHFLNIRNSGRNNRQVFHDSFGGDYGGFLAGAMGRLTIDMGLTQVVGATMSVPATDWLCLEAVTITNFPMA